MLPLPSKNRPTFDKQSSCEIALPPTQLPAGDVPISNSYVEMYEHGTNLWNEISEEIEDESGIVVPDLEDISSALVESQENKSMSINHIEE